MLLLLYCLPLLFKVLQRSRSCCCCYIVYHYSFRFDRGLVHVVVILSTITVLGLSEEWFMFFFILYIITLSGLTEEWFMFWLLYCLPLLSKVWQKGSSCCGCYIVSHYCLRCSCFGWYIVYHYCLRFDKGVVHVGVFLLYIITVLGLTEECFMLLLYCIPLLFKVW